MTPADSKPRISLLVTDLDNTLYDWVSFFAIAFYRLVDEACELLSVPREQLLDELQAVHRHYHNSEHPFALLETPSVERNLAGLTRRERLVRLTPAFHAFNHARQQTLKLYPGVLETLAAISSSGCRIVAHTEATVANAQFRLSMLGLTPHIERLYAVEFSGPDHPDPERRRTVNAVTQVRSLRQDERKPDPRVLFDICADMGIPPQATLYVGDSIARDIGMAKVANVWAAWAKYGTQYEKRLWTQLVRVTHWTAADVARAQDAQMRFGDTKPDAVLHTSFAELMDHFNFETPAV